jgi:hypothetical protein
MQKQCYVVLSTITKSVEIQRAVTLVTLYFVGCPVIQSAVTRCTFLTTDCMTATCTHLEY